MTTVLVTGANRGIGQALVEEALRRGHDVIAAMRDPAAAPAYAGGAPRILALDAASDASVAAAAAAVDGPVDILVNNAGISGPKTRAGDTIDFAGFLETLDVNTVGPMRVTAAFLPHLKRGALKKVATISSGMGELNANSDWTPYRVSKVAVNKLMRALATDLAPHGVAVATLCPGWVRTAMGGPNATISPEESAKGLFNVIDGLNLASTGFYKNQAGRTLPWAA
jgi:NAD(P)-dependent dehydrogenase (short-subunit alcohol dehydrogenase family)